MILTEHAAVVANVHLALDNQVLLHVDVEGGLCGELAAAQLAPNYAAMYGALRTNINYSKILNLKLQQADVARTHHMTVKTSACIEVGAALAAGVSGAADVGVRLVVLHKNGCITEVAITAASGAGIA